MKIVFHSLAIICSTLFLACSSDDPVNPGQDTEKPIITIISPKDLSEPLRGIVTVKAEAVDNSSIAKVEVFVDGALLGSATSSPIEATWDTKTVSDGMHEIKIVAEDAEGNTEEQSLTIEVQNILFTFPVGAAYISEKTEQWVFISDESGAVVDVKQLTNGETYTVSTPEGFTKDKRYYFTRLQYYFDDFGGVGSYVDSYFTTYANVKSGTYKLDFEQRVIPPVIGQHQIFVSGSPTELHYELASLGAKRGFFFGSTPSLTPIVVGGAANLDKSPSDLLYYFYNFDDVKMGKNLAPIYHLIVDATIGGETIVDHASLSSFSFNQIDFVGATESYYRISYLRKAEEYQGLRVFLEQNNLITPNELKMYSPEITFPEYITDISYSMGSTEYFYQKASIAVALEFKQLQGSISDFSRTGNKISIQTSGTYTHAGASSYLLLSDFDSEGTYGWALFGPKNGTVALTVPEIPAEILAAHPGVGSVVYDFEKPTLYNFIGLTDYDAVVDARFTGKSLYKEVKERTSMTQSFAPSGGRVGNKRGRSLRSHDIPEMDLLEDIKR